MQHLLLHENNALLRLLVEEVDALLEARLVRLPALQQRCLLVQPGRVPSVICSHNQTVCQKRQYFELRMTTTVINATCLQLNMQQLPH